MGRSKTGGAYTARGKHYARPMVGGKRTPVLLPTAASKTEARERAAVIAEVVATLEQHALHERVPAYLKTLATCASADVADVLLTLAEDCAEASGAPAPAEVGRGGTPWRPSMSGLQDDWKSGELHRKHPDHVKLKRSSREDGWRFDKHIKPYVGEVLVTEFTRDHAKLVMAKLPEGLSPITRRHVAQQMNRLLTMAVWPLELIAENPIPRGFLPRMKKSKLSLYLYPDEEAQLLGCKDVPLERRVLYAMLSREGMRKEEAASLLWAQLDLDRGGITLEDHKTADEAGARFWPLDPSMAEALRRWRTLNPKKEYVFRYGTSGVRELGHLADFLRADLGTAKVTRAELFKATTGRLQLRAHDLRAGFCTLALAMGRTEQWCMDRTGHTKSSMLQRYKKGARHAGEANLGWWKPAHEAIPELAEVGILAKSADNTGYSASDGQGSEGQKDEEDQMDRHDDSMRQNEVLGTGSISRGRCFPGDDSRSKRDFDAPHGSHGSGPSPIVGGDNGDAATLRRLVSSAVERGDLTTAKVLLSELERLEDEAQRAALAGKVTPITSARKRGDR